ncbi:MAG TPA: NPCBM/NEW2 domain-containing protein [Pirellulales bacterium]|nr:NPCBM/NEW2 domain-containing protein [Pirellulales bacterium]
MAGWAARAEEAGRGMLLDASHTRAEARLVGVSAEGRFTFQVGKDTRRVPTAELVAWGAPVEPRDAPQVLLANGSLLVVREILKTQDERLLLDSDAVGEFAAPLSTIAGVLLHPPIDPQRRDRLAARFAPPAGRPDEPLPEPPPRGDRLLLENGDELHGRITAVTDTAVEFTADVGPLTVDRQRIIALGFASSQREGRSSPQRLLVGLRGGSVLNAAALTLDHDQAQVNISDDLRLTAPAAAVVYAQTIGGRAAYLSDLEPESYRHLPYLSIDWPYRLDANVTGTRLRAGGKIYAKGVGMHSTARLTFRLEKAYRRFQAELAIDDQTQLRGSVVFRVLAGPREIYKSGVVRGGDPPLPISVDIGGATQLSLVVDYADRADELDHADWLNARLIE